MKARILMVLAPLAIFGLAGMASAEKPANAFPGVEHVTTQASVEKVETRLLEALDSLGVWSREIVGRC